MKYQLHDYEIDSVVLENDSVIFSFPNGFYVEEENGQPAKPLKRKLIFHIDTNGFALDTFLSIRKISWNRKRWQEISFKQFTILFKKGTMIIHDEYDSKSTNWKMLQLNTCARGNNIELFIMDIKDVECLE